MTIDKLTLPRLEAADEADDAEDADDAAEEADDAAEEAEDAAEEADDAAEEVVEAAEEADEALAELAVVGTPCGAVVGAAHAARTKKLNSKLMATRRGIVPVILLLSFPVLGFVNTNDTQSFSSDARPGS